jgi:hypothetical protein
MVRPVMSNKSLCIMVQNRRGCQASSSAAELTTWVQAGWHIMADKDGRGQSNMSRTIHVTMMVADDLCASDRSTNNLLKFQAIVLG